ncbi:hypothetical protein [Arenibaculum pallidiluteum]|uniref:hypothetical protein n=1 Tax=Arenibaculum pallidiluteum TaxID=2812559 RepID=UPI001A96CFCE|nr:hypothetical protein [Arenibaculum pallidiluteum]
MNDARAARDAGDGELCGDDELGYLRCRTPFAPGAGLVLDEAYRLAHLPLVAPGHPGVIATWPGRPYAMGRHPRSYSLVLPVPGEALARSDAYCALEAELRAAPFASKIAWDILPRRLPVLHATLCGGLGAEEPPQLPPAALSAIAGIGPIAVELRGIFSGDVNLGRLYLRAYPARRAGANPFRRIQALLGRRESDLHLVGVFNLTDDLDPAEAEALGALIARWWDRPLLRFEAEALWLLGAEDDLVLEGSVEAAIPLA